MVVWTVLVVLAATITAEAASPDPPSPGITTVGSLKLGTAADCAGVVAFSATNGAFQTADKPALYKQTLVNKGVGYVAQTGVFTTHCPGLYQFSFAGRGSSDVQLHLKEKRSGSDSTWTTVVQSGPGSGGNLILLDVEAGDQLAVFNTGGTGLNGVTFSGLRVAKK